MQEAKTDTNNCLINVFFVFPLVEANSPRCLDEVAAAAAAKGYRLPDPLPQGEIIKAKNTKEQWKLGKSIGEAREERDNRGKKCFTKLKLVLKIFTMAAKFKFMHFYDT